MITHFLLAVEFLCLGTGVGWAWLNTAFFNRICPAVCFTIQKSKKVNNSKLPVKINSIMVRYFLAFFNFYYLTGMTFRWLWAFHSSQAELLTFLVQ